MELNVSITEATNNKERLTLQKFFERRIPNVPKDAIQQIEWDYATEFYALQAHDYTGKLVGAISVGAPYRVFLGKAKMCPLELVQENIRVSSRIREIDFLAVDEKFRGKGLGSELLEKIEQKYKDKGFSVLYGSAVVKENGINRLLEFYQKNGYSVSEDLPPFFGLSWFDPMNKPHFYFYKRL